jgi:hypothetical protein
MDGLAGSTLRHFGQGIAELNVQFLVLTPHVLGEVCTTQYHRAITMPFHDKHLSFHPCCFA